MSGYHEEEVEESRVLVLAKPFSPQQLAEKVREALAGRLPHVDALS
jgi:hypothetical protein